ncbi:leucyl/phenylalanyl-tRNA--protein transferase [Parvibaculum sedimenti]|uniref:Leucyl/phenylalanyl-tRNA--protein transferase n=1 Tax=Parvibaculum sedimenti TaxID=2608632 RepID=A0A6N6VM14_9HYPH|nr:leucyl/phenylalanyl-tRNA--protein transferase [Parvibaculum sedimenti]KAB7740520.1 leucyl/phenylalanyl-tRNA--protein transferase [Parvibaculum sedimenti]
MSNVDADVLLRAYAYGVFPMAESRDDPELYWIDPERRGILPLDGFHLPRRLKRTVRSAPFEVRIDTSFRGVMLACAESAPDREGTWINDRILDLYGELFARGNAHSVECWQSGRLVGGLYGVSLGAAFFGESMFSRETDASKVALVYLIARLIAGGYKLLDTQFVTEHLKQFGTIEIPRDIYRARLHLATLEEADFYRLPLDAGPEEVLQVLSHTS